MHIIVIRVGIITHPMTQSIIRMLLDYKVKVSVVTTKNQIDLNKHFNKKVDIHELEVDYTKPANIFMKFFRLLYIRKQMWKEIDSIYCEDSVLWVGHNITIKHLGNKLLKYRYILHLNELNENIAYWPKLPVFKLNANKIGNTALAVIVPEYNRAHIVKALWNLKKLPYIMPNKPYLYEMPARYSQISHSENAKKIIKKLKGKKIIIYQGAISAERRLDIFVKAVGELGSDYAFLIMSNIINNLSFKLPDNCYCIEYINAPYHLEVTSHAYIGVLSYIPEKTSNSILNSLYCAPNKIFEYSMFGIPMIGNDIPGLNMLFKTEKCGECILNEMTEEVKKAIKKIEENYSDYSKNSKLFYNSVDNYKKMKKIIEDVKKNY